MGAKLKLCESGEQGKYTRRESLREYRKSRHENQEQFWSRFGVTQSRGSRFEKGTEIPSPVAILLRLYFDGKITDGDLRRSEC